MKEYIVTGLLTVLFTLAGQSQIINSQQNLEQISAHELFNYLTAAQKLEATGGVLLIAVPVSAITGLALASISQRGGSEVTWKAGLGMIIASAGFAAVGIPTFITGSSRVKKVTKVLSSKYTTARIDLFPGTLYNYQTQNIQPGITFRIRF